MSKRNQKKAAGGSIVRRGRRVDVVLLINGVLVGIGGVFVVTTSVAVTIVAAVAAVSLAVVVVLAGR